MTVDSRWAERTLHHARHVAARIGPRGAATREEEQAADYTQRQMQQMGLRDVRVETFRTTASGWLPITIIFSIAVWGVFACWSLFYLTQTHIVGALVAIGLCLVALAFLYLEITLRDHPLRRLALRGTSHNAIGRIAPTGPVKQRAVLISNLDTAPVTAVLKTPRRARLFRAVFYVGAASLVGSVVCYLLGGLDLWEWAFVFAGIFGLLQSAVIVQSLRADHGEFTAGANHNASGLGTVLALAERLRGAPLQNTEVWVVCSGSHMAGNGGLRALLRQHAAELHAAWFIGFEGVGMGDRLVYFSREGWLRRTVHPAIRDLIARTIEAHPTRKIEARAISRDSVVATAMWRGYKSACLSIWDTGNDIPFAYSRADTPERLQLTALDAVQEFGWQLLEQIDQGQKPGEGRAA
jgi:hypothetical protein